MKAKLIKTRIDWLLIVNNNQVAGSLNEPDLSKGVQKLSIKNCEAIANGYDLDELGTEAYKKHNIDNLSLHEEIQRSGAFLVGHKEGFQKALEILGDKKFSEEDMRKGFESGYETYNEHYDKLINSLQKTEWDVEILMESKDIDELRVDKGSFLKPNDIYKPRLDAAGCLILKRI